MRASRMQINQVYGVGFFGMSRDASSAPNTLTEGTPKFEDILQHPTEPL